jgi:two-component system response regulator CpxR
MLPTLPATDKPQRILLADDDDELCAMLVDYLAGEGFDCDTAHDGATALHMALHSQYQAVVLDVMMPRLNGFEVMRRLREQGTVPILMLTARGEENDSIIGLEIGADDYLTKPCSPRMLAVRLRAVLRRSGHWHAAQPASVVSGVLTMGRVSLHAGSRKVFLDGDDLNLTSAEFNLLHVLMREAGQVVSRETLCQQALGRRLTTYDRSVEIHISTLRRKLGQSARSGNPICTVRGVGYLYAMIAEGEGAP